jgi:predicted dehydrogenase
LLDLGGQVRSWRRSRMPDEDIGWDGSEQRYFLDHVAAGRPAKGAAGLATALHVQEVIDAGYASARTGQAVRIGQ